MNFLEVEDWKEIHGFRGDESWAAPQIIKHCDTEARPGYQSKKAHEYHDTKEVLEAKVKEFARMLSDSKNCVVYSGAGLSTASGIGDYATKAGKPGESLSDPTPPHLRSPLLAKPTYSHRVLAKLCELGTIKRWIQQNHDGLPQKAGVPQHLINEIHGAWFDVSNPIVKMSGELRTDLFEDMTIWEKTTDLTISIGTSMCGMNADRVFTTVATKAKSGVAEALGGVIISLQQTQYDNISALRIFATIDDVMILLSQELELGVEKGDVGLYSIPESLDSMKVDEDVFLIPYDRLGKLLPKEKRMNKSFMTVLDLRVGSKYRVSQGPYKDDQGEVIGKNLQNNYRLVTKHRIKGRDGKCTLRAWESLFGSWWVEAAVRGTIKELPLCSVNPPHPDCG